MVNRLVKQASMKDKETQEYFRQLKEKRLEMLKEDETKRLKKLKWLKSLMSYNLM